MATLRVDQPWHLRHVGHRRGAQAAQIRRCPDWRVLNACRAYFHSLNNSSICAKA